jgi:hypothetical protein
LELNRDDLPGSLVFRTTLTDGAIEQLSLTISIKKGEKCKAAMSEGIGRMAVSFSLMDFSMTVRIGQILNQRLSMHLEGPGHPVVIKASMPNQIQFEMPLATAIDEDARDEEEQQRRKLIYSRIFLPLYHALGSLGISDLRMAKAGYWPGRCL